MLFLINQKKDKLYRISDKLLECLQLSKIKTLFKISNLKRKSNLIISTTITR